MASSTTLFSLSSFPATLPPVNFQHRQLPLYHSLNAISTKKKASFRVQAAKIPAGVETPKVEPKFTSPFLGFTKTAEVWNSRACMIGLIGTFIVELIINKGILQVIGVEVGKGLNLPL